MQKSYENRLKRAKKALDEAEYVLIGGGSGLSSAAGLTYSGRRFEENFADFIRRYHVTDMYSAGFTPFPSEEEKWAYWSRHILFNRYLPPALPLYLTLYALVKDKKYFVLTTNVDGAFSKAGFDEARLFEAQGNYGLFQCAKGCHDTLYDNEASVKAMAEVQQDCPVFPRGWCRAVPSAAEKWRCTCVRTPFSYRTRPGIGRRNAIESFFRRQKGKGRRFWSWGWASIRRRSFDFPSNG